MAGEIIPFYDIALDFEGEPLLGDAGYQLITDEDLIKQYVKNLIFLEFDPFGYVGLPNEKSTADIIKEDLTEILVNDILLASLSLVPILDIYPKDTASLGFELVLTDNEDLIINMGDTAFINLRSGVMLGYGEYDLTNQVYDVESTLKRFERRTIVKSANEFILTHKSVGVSRVFVANNADVLGFDSAGIPILPGLTKEGVIQVDRFNSTILLADVLDGIDGYVAYTLTMTELDGRIIPATAYQLINNYIVMDFVYTDYRGIGNITVEFIKAVTAVTKYIETPGAYVPDYAAHERTNTQYKAVLGTSIPPGKYVILYDSYGVR